MLELRLATEADVKDLAVIYSLSFKSSAPDETWSVQSASSLIKFFLDAPQGIVIVATSDHNLVGGICGLIKPWWNGNRIVDTEFFVHPNYQRQDVGRRLLIRYLERAKQNYSAQEIESITFRQPDFPSSWYERMGFKEKPDWKVMTGNVEQVLKLLAT